MLTGLTPHAFCNLDKVILHRPGNGTSASQRLQLPRLRAVSVIPSIRFNGTNNRALFAFGAQPWIKWPNVSLGSWLRHGEDEILRGPGVIADKQNVQVRAIADLVSAEFTEGDDG